MSDSRYGLVNQKVNLLSAKDEKLHRPLLRIGILILILLLLASLSQAQDKRCLSVDDFRSFGRCNSVTEVIEKMGKPDGDSCSGMYCLIYLLCDGKSIRIVAGSNSEIQSLKVIEGDRVKEVLIGPAMKRADCGKGKNRR